MLADPSSPRNSVTTLALSSCFRPYVIVIHHLEWGPVMGRDTSSYHDATTITLVMLFDVNMSKVLSRMSVDINLTVAKLETKAGFICEQHSTPPQMMCAPVMLFDGNMSKMLFRMSVDVTLTIAELQTKAGFICEQHSTPTQMMCAPVMLFDGNMSKVISRIYVDVNLTVAELETKAGLICEQNSTPTTDDVCTSDIWLFCGVMGVVVEQSGESSIHYWVSDNCGWFDQTVEFHLLFTGCHIIGMQWLCVDVEPYW